MTKEKLTSLTTLFAVIMLSGIFVATYKYGFSFLSVLITGGAREVGLILSYPRENILSIILIIAGLIGCCVFSIKKGTNEER